MKYLIFLSLFISVMVSCEDTSSPCENAEEGILRDFKGFDGCGWIIQLDESTRLEPTNLNDFDIDLVDNKSVCIQYHIREDLASTCMVGVIVEIDEISESN